MTTRTRAELTEEWMRPLFKGIAVGTYEDVRLAAMEALENIAHERRRLDEDRLVIEAIARRYATDPLPPDEPAGDDQ